MNFKDYSTQQLRSVIIYSLDNDLIPSAEFAAERLVAETGEEDLDSIHLYGLVLMKRQRFKAAYNLTANLQHVGCSYVFAKSALALNMATEGIYALTSTQHIWQALSDSLSSSYEFERKLTPDPAVFFSLLGKLYATLGDTRESSINHSKALKRNPFLWESFEELNRIGANVRVKAIYKVLPGVTFNLKSHSRSGTNSELNIRDPFGDTSVNNKQLPQHKSYGKTIIEESPRGDSSPELQTPRLKNATVPNAPTRRVRSVSSREAYKQPLPVSDGDTIKRAPRFSASNVTSRLMSHPLTGKPQNSTTSRKNSVSELTHSSKRGKSFLSMGSNDTASSYKKRDFLSNEEIGEQHLLNIYSQFAKGLKAMSRYDCFKAIRILTSLPEAHLNTAWVLSRLGRLHFEVVNYEESELYFKKLRKLDRTRVDDMEYYSTLLWHLHKEVELCHLAHELLSINRNSPQAWVAVGNLFSLSREPDEALKCFQRATQIDEKFSYAYTLQGHEYVANDSYENALESFRLALLMDPRHYNALYGIGMVYLKLGNFTRAEYHFRKAVDINPVNVILICCVGMMLEKLGKRELALAQYELACKIQPSSALALFKKAQLLFSLEQYNSALVDFEYLSTVAPDEASVHFLLGQLYKLSNRKNDAIKQFTIALNLDPKGSHLVKEALESLTE